ncbi:MAG: DUF11 domain-containing protein [Burkholderiales bacterium]|nr:DUF11 domain-containing protein [Burkholderiales bacterium]
MSLRRLLAVTVLAAASLAATAPALAQVCAAPGVTGTASVTGVVNTYYASTGSAFAGSSSIPVSGPDGRGAATPIAAGDLLLVVQVQDAAIDSTNTATYGGSGGGAGYTSLNNAGRYEYAVAAGPVSGGLIPLAAPLANTYTHANASSVQGQRRFQVIRVPQYSSATITGTVTAPPWDGASGGIVAFDVAGTLNWGGQAIDVNGRGFRGGGAQCSTSGFGVNTDYRTSSAGRTINLAGTGNNPNGTKGEGVAGTPILVFTPTTPFDNSAGTITNTGGADGTTGGYPNGSFGRGAPGNAGGGGTDGNPTANDQNTGGGGGGNFGIGGKGGFGWTPGTPPGFDTGGYGGMSMPLAPARLFFGGGGGSGSTNNCTGTPANGRATSGGAGGGMVLIRAGSTTGSGAINARGTSGNSTITNDASGGGGAGGAVLVFVDNGGAPIGATVDIRGGNGGSNTGGGSPHGPGGGGSGGYAALSGTATVNLAGGVNGTTATSPTSTAEYGSTTSVGGFNIVNLGPAQIPGAGVSSACFPVLTVTKSTATPYVSAGAPATWTITVANQAGKGAADNVVIADALPANPNITYAATTAVTLAGGATRPATANPVAGTPTPSWGSFRIPGGGSVSITFTATVTAAVASGVYQNPATVTYLDPTRTAAQTVTPGGTYTAGGTVPGTNYVAASTANEDITVINPPPSFTKSFAPSAITPGATAVMTIVVNNPNPLALTNAGFTDNYPPGLVNTAAPGGASSCGGTVTAAAGGSTLALTGATIPASGSCTITANVTITASGSYANTLPVAALANTQNITNTVAATATLYSNVTVAKSFSPTAVAPGADATLTIAITNPNTVPVSLANPGLTDNFPPNLRATGGAVAVAGAGCAGFAPATIAANATSLVLTAGTVPAGGTCTVTLVANSAVTGTYNNTTSGVTTLTTGTTGPPSNTASLGVGLVSIAKNFSPAQIQAGGVTTLTYTLSNPTGVPQTGGQFLDPLINMQLSANQALGGTCTGMTPATASAGDTLVSLTGINIPAGSCTVTVQLTSSVVGTHPNAANGVSTSLLPQGPGSNTDYLTVIGKPAIAKAFTPAAVPVGGASTLTFTITNPNAIPLTGIAFTDAYPAGIVNATPLAVGGTCPGVTTTATAGGASFNVTGGTVAAGASCTITVGVTGTTAGAWNNTASGVASAESGTAGAGSNTATLTVSSPATITKAFGTSPIPQGGTSVATFTLANPNATPLTNLRFTDALANMSVASATIGGTCAGTFSTPALLVGATALDLTVPTLAGGASCTVTVTLTSAVSGTHPNITSGVTSTQTPVAGAPSNTASLTVLTPPALQKNFVPGTIEAGANAAIVFTVSNPQAVALSSVSFSDPLVNMALGAGAGVTETCSGVVTPVGVAAGSTSFTLTLNTLAASESCTITVSPVTSTVSSPAAGHPNTTGGVTSTQTAVNPGAGATGNLRVVVPPTITKSFSPAAIATGGTSTVTFTITNPNAVALTDVRFTDDLPANLLNSAAQTFIGGGRGTCSGTIPSAKVAGNLDPVNFASTNVPANSSCTILMDVTSSTVGAYTNTVTAITSDQTPTATAGGSDVLTVGAMGINKRFCTNLPAATPGASTCTPATDAQVNAPVYLWIQVTNNTGTSNVNDLYFNDALPAGMQTVAGDIFVSRVAGQCDESPNPIPNEAGGATTFNFNAGRHLDDLDAGASCIVSVPVTSTTAGLKSNTVTGANPAALNGRTDTATINFWQPPTIAKAFSPATIGAGGTSTLTITLTNPAANPGPITGAAFSDTLANMSVAGNQSVGGTCTGTTPASLTNGQTGLIAFSGIGIPQGGSCTVTFTVTSTNVGVNPNSTTGVTSAQAPTAGAGSAVANLTVAGTALTKAFSPATITAGTVSRLTFTIANGAGNPAQPLLAFTETLPAGVTIASPANAATDCAGGAVSATAGGAALSLSGASLAPGDASCTVGVDVTSASAGTYNNLPANITGLSPGLSAAGLSATLTVNASPALTKAFLPASVAPGTPSVLTFTVANGAGNPAQTGLAFTDNLPAGVVVAAAPNVQSNCPTGGGFAAPAFTVTATPGTGAIAVSGAALDAGVASCQVRVSVTATALGNFNNNASNIAGLAGGLTAAGANATLSSVGTALTKSFSPTVIGRGGVSTMTFTVTNGAGNPAQSGLQFTENLPANLFVAPVPNLVNTCGGTVTATAGAGTIPFTGGSLAAGVGSCTISVDVTSAFVASYPNPPSRILNASATMDTSGVNATLEVLENVEVTKAFAPATVPAGTPGTLTITLANVNGTPLAGVAFTDTYAGAIANAPVPNGATTCGGTVTAVAGANSVALAGGTVPAYGSCTVTVSVVGTAPGAQANTIPVGGVTTTNAGANGVAANATLTVVARPTVTKAYSPAQIGTGGTATLTITLANANAATAITGVAFTDTQPAPVTTVPATAATTCGGTASQAAGSVTLAGGTIPAAGSCTVTVVVTSATVGDHANTIAAGDLASANAGTNAAAANATLSVLAAPTVAKAFAPASIFPNATSVLTITLTNPNAADITGAAFTDNYPGAITNTATPAGSTTCAGGTVTAAPNGTSLALSGATIPGGGSCTVTVNVTSNTVGVHANSTGAVTTANAGTAAGAGANLAVVGGLASTKLFSPISVALGGTSTLTITLTNPNTTTAVSGIAFTDTYPTGIANSGTPGAATTCPGGTVTAVAGGGSLALAGATLAAGANCTVTVQVAGTTAGTHVNAVGTITAANAPSITGDSTVLFVYAPPTAAKSFTPASIGSGATSTLALEVGNPAANPATAITGVALADPLGTFNLSVAAPAAATFTPAACGTLQSRATVGSGAFGALTAGHAEVRLDVASLAPGDTCRVELGVTSTTPGAANNTTAAPTAAGPVPLTGTAASATLTVVRPALTKAFGAAAINDGATTTLVFTLANAGANPAQSGIGFTDTLPAGLAFDSAAPVLAYSAGCSGPAAASYVAGTRVLTIAGVAMAGGTASCTVTAAGLTNAPAQVSASCPAAAFTNGAGAIGSLANATNAVTDQCLVVNRVNPALTKAFSPATIDQGGVSTLTFTIANGGTNPAQAGIAFTDTLPGTILVANPPAVSTNCPSGTGAVTATAGAGSIAVAGASLNALQASCTISVNVTGNTAGSYPNTDAGNITGAANVTTTGVSATLTVLPLPALTKAFSPASVGTGENAVLTFSIANLAGGPPRTGLLFTDALPPNLVIGTPAGVVNNCGGSPTVTATPGAGTFAVGGAGVNAAAGPSTCTISVNVASGLAGTYVNGAAQVTPGGGLLNAVTDQALAVLDRPAVAKAFGAASIAPGGTTTLTVTLSNPNGVAVTGAAFTDVFPAAPGAMTLANATASNTCGGTLADNGGGALGAGDAGIQLAGGTIPAGGSCAVTVNVTAAAPGTYTNTLAAGAVTSANAGASLAAANASLVVTAPPTIAKAFAPATIAADGTSTITFTLANPNPLALTAAAFTDTLASMAIAANGNAGGTCAGAAGNAVTAGQVALSLAGLTIPAGGSCTVTVVVTSDIPGAHGNQASGVSSAEAATGAASNVATLTVTAAAPTIAKAFAPATIAADGTSTATFTLGNANGVPLTAAGFTDALANMAIAANGNAGGTCAGAAGNALTAGQAALTLSGLTVPANGSCTVTVVVTSDTPGAHPNTTSGVTSAEAPVGAASNTATLTVTAVAPAIAKAFSPATIAAGATSTITFTITNSLGVPLTGGAFTDTLANMAIAANGNAGGTCGGAAGNAFTAGQTALAFTGLTVPANASCTVTVVVTSAVPGAHNNATSAFTSAEAPASAASNTAVLTVTAVAPTIAKAFAPAAIVADGTSTITFTITNPQAIALTSSNFTDTLANLSIAAAGAAGGTCAGAAGNVFSAGQTALAFTGLTIPASSSCTVTVVVSSDLPGVHPNQASGVASTQAPTGAASNVANLTVTAAPPTIAKAFAPAGIPVFGTSTITFTLANANGIPLTAASFTDTLANMQVNAAGPAGGTCAGAGGNALTAGQTALALSGLTIPANGSCTVTVVVASSVVGTHPNQASGVASAEAATGAASNVANLTVQPLPPTIAKQFTPAGILSGGTSTLVVTIGNPNPSPITVTSVTDTYPVGVTTAGTPAASTTCLPGGVVTFNAGSVTLTGGTVPATGSCTFQVAVTAATQGAYTNTIPAGALTTSGGFNTAPASATLTVDPVADVAVVKTAPATVGTGQSLSYTVSVVNNGPDAANGTQLADTVPAQVTGVSAVCGAASGGAACGAVSVAGNVVTSTIPTLPAGGSVTFTITGTATGLGATSNTATVAAPGGVFDPVPGNNSSTAATTILAPDLTLAKSHAGNFTVGVNGTYSLTVSNGAGSLATTGTITVVDTLPAGLLFVSGGGTGWSCAAAGQAVTCTTAAPIAAGATAPVLSITVAVSSTAVPGVLNIATVSGGGEPAAAGGNNTASDNTIVTAAAANAFAPDGAQTGLPGTVVFYPHTFNAGLAGSVALATTAVAAPAVPGWTQAIYRDTNCNGALDGAEGAAPLAGAVAVNPGDAVCIIVRDSIPGAAPYNAQNVISVTATFNGATTFTRTDTTTVGAVGGAGLTLAKTVRNVTQGGAAATTGTARPDDVLEYTITYTNAGSGPVSALVVTDATPAFTRYQSAACAAPPANLTGCSVTSQPAVNGTGSIVWTLTGSLLPGGTGSVSYQVRVNN